MITDIEIDRAVATIIATLNDQELEDQTYLVVLASTG
jgi:hypothetical protein